MSLERSLNTLFDWYLNLVKTYDLGTHTGVLGFVITIVGFWVTLYNMFKLSRNSRDLAVKLEQTRAMIATIDTVRDLSSAMELLKQVRQRLILADVNDVPNDLMELRLALVRIREAHPAAPADFSSCVQGLITRLQDLETKILGSLVNGTEYSKRKLQADLKTLGDCLNDLQTFLSKTQTLACDTK